MLLRVSVAGAASWHCHWDSDRHGWRNVLEWNCTLWKSTCIWQWPFLHAETHAKNNLQQKFLFFPQCCLGLLARECNDNSLCLQRVFPSFWCLLITSPFRYTQFPSLLNSCKPTSSLLSSVVNTCAMMFILFSLSPGIIPAKDVKPLCKIEFKSFPLWRRRCHPYH